MANFYLRVPTYVADFYRHRDEKHPLTEWQPVEFRDYDYEMQIIRHGLVPDNVRKQLSVMCYSEQSWKNVLRGRFPMGGKTVIIRDKDKWPVIKELLTLEGRNLKPNEEHFDYLCIAMPREALVGSRIVKPDGKYALNASMAKMLSTVLRDEYLHYYYEWCMQEQRMFSRKNIEIDKTTMMERFYAQYEIRMGVGGMTHNAMRQQAKRIFDRALNAKTRRTQMMGEFFDYTPLKYAKSKQT